MYHLCIRSLVVDLCGDTTLLGDPLFLRRLYKSKICVLQLYTAISLFSKLFHLNYSSVLTTFIGNMSAT